MGSQSSDKHSEKQPPTLLDSNHQLLNNDTLIMTRWKIWNIINLTLRVYL